MTTTKTGNEVKNLTASLKRIVPDGFNVRTKNGNGASALILSNDGPDGTIAGYGPFYICTNGKGYTVIDDIIVHFFDDAEAVKGYFRSVFDGE